MTASATLALKDNPPQAEGLLFLIACRLQQLLPDPSARSRDGHGEPLRTLADIFSFSEIRKRSPTISLMFGPLRDQQRPRRPPQLWGRRSALRAHVPFCYLRPLDRRHLAYLPPEEDSHRSSQPQDPLLPRRLGTQRLFLNSADSNDAFPTSVVDHALLTPRGLGSQPNIAPETDLRRDRGRPASGPCSLARSPSATISERHSRRSSPSTVSDPLPRQ